MKRISIYIQLLLPLWTWLLVACLPGVCSGQEVACVDLVPDTTWTITKCVEVESQLHTEYMAAQKQLRETRDEAAWNEAMDDYEAFTSKSYKLVQQLEKIIDYHLDANKEENLRALNDSIGWLEFGESRNPYVELLRVCSLKLRIDKVKNNNLDFVFCFKQTQKLTAAYSHYCPKSLLNAILHVSNIHAYDYFGMYDYDKYSKGMMNSFHQFDKVLKSLSEKNFVQNALYFGVLYFAACMKLLDPKMQYAGLISDKEQKQILEDLKLSLAEIKRAVFFYDSDQRVLRNNYARAMAVVKNFDYRLFRNVMLPTDWNMHNEFTDSVARVKIDSYALEKERLSISEKGTLWLLKTYLGEVTPDVAVRQMDAYDAELKALDSPFVYAKDNLASMINRTFLLDISSMSEKKKHEKALEYSRAIVSDLEQMNMENGSGATKAITYARLDRLLKQLTSKERYNFELSMMKAMHSLDMGHSMTVDALCQVTLKRVMEMHPELLVGLPMVPTAKALSNKMTRQQLMQFMHVAALIHDVGTATLPNVYMGKFRPLTDVEEELEQHHTEKGLQFLMVDPSLSVYSDFVLGHHKWYNGKRGNPKWHDNTLSDYRVLVDLLTICNDLEESTSVLYSGDKVKTFDETLKTMSNRRFTVYNPVLVDMLVQDAELAGDLKQILTSERRRFYYMAVTGQ